MARVMAVIQTPLRELISPITSNESWISNSNKGRAHDEISGDSKIGPTARDFLSKTSGFTSTRVFNSHWKFYRNIFTASRITAFTIFHSVFQNYAEIVDGHLYRSVFNPVKQFIWKHVLNVHPSFHTSLKSFYYRASAQLCYTSPVLATFGMSVRPSVCLSDRHMLPLSENDAS